MLGWVHSQHQYLILNSVGLLVEHGGGCPRPVLQVWQQRDKATVAGTDSDLHEVVEWDCYTPEIVWISGGALGKPRPSSTPMKITSRAQVQLRPPFQCKTKYSTYVSACFFHPLFTLPLQKLIFSLSFCTLPFIFLLYFMRPQSELNLGCWVTERLTVKGREREQRWRRKSSAGGGHRRSFSPPSPFSWHTTARAATEALLSIRIFPLSSPSLNDKRGEQAWAGIIGSFLSASAMCEDRNNGPGPGGEMIQSEIFTCSLQPGPGSFQSMLMPVHLQSTTVSCNTHKKMHRSFFSSLCDGQFRLLCSRTSISVIILIIIIIPFSELNKN